MLEFLKDIIKWLIPIVIPPIRIELHTLSFTDLADFNQHGVVTSCPRRYSLKLSLTNRTDKAVYIKEASLLNSGRAYAESGHMTDLRLEPHERKTLNVVFPVDTEAIPKTEGEFILTIVPAIGRPTKMKARLPMLT